MTAIGSVEWLERTRGRLSRRESLELVRLGVRAQAAFLPGRVRAALGIKPQRLARLDPSDVRIPDSAAAREAEELCGALSAAVAGHSQRCYLWGAVLAAHDGVKFDEELLYVACLLHDTGMPVAAAGSHENCFTLDSVHVVRGAQAQLEPARRHTVEDAIARHLNPSVPLEAGSEAHLLNAGAALDLAGMRHWEIAPATRDAILHRHPRAGLKAEWDGLCRRHMQAMPDGRVRWLYRYGGFGLLVKHAPFDS